MAQTAGCVLASMLGSMCEGPAGLDSASLSSPVSPVWCRLRTNTWATTSSAWLITSDDMRGLSKIRDWQTVTLKGSNKTFNLTFIWLFFNDWLPYLALALSWLLPSFRCWMSFTSSKVKGRAHESLSTGLTCLWGELDRDILPSAAWEVK